VFLLKKPNKSSTDTTIAESTDVDPFPGIDPFYNRNWLTSLMTSPHKKEALAVRDQYLKEISEAKYSIEQPSNKILVGILVSCNQVDRRHHMRAHQINTYNSYKDITFRFVLGKPDPAYHQAITYENNTYGDLIILDNVPDDRENARTIKPYEFFKYIEKNLPVYKYIAKLDTDCFLNIPMFWNNYFNETVQELEYAIIGLFIKGLGRFEWPQGGFELISWKIMLWLNKFYPSVPRSADADDLQLAWFLYDAEINYTKVEFDPVSSYDFRSGCNAEYITDVFPYSMRIHELKVENDYLNVASCFTSDGVNMTRVTDLRITNFTE
jgi:hypothetical protein